MLRGKRWRKLLTIKEEKGLCATVQLYMKDILDQILENANEPKHCPIRKVSIFRDIKITTVTNLLSYLTGNHFSQKYEI